MRIVSGRFRGRRLAAPAGSKTRPTADRVRESLFSMLTSRFDFDGAHILDLYAGSGALGLGALSRGAASAVFVDSDRDACSVIRRNAEQLDVLDESRIIRGKADAFIAKRGASTKFDFAFADPPYHEDPSFVLEHMSDLVRPGGAFVLEHDGAISLESRPGHLATRAFGRTRVSIFELP